MSACSREAWAGVGACLYCSLCGWDFNKLAKLASLGLWPFLPNHTGDGGACLLDSTSPPPWGLAKGRGWCPGTEEVLRKERSGPSLEGLTAQQGR